MSFSRCLNSASSGAARPAMTGPSATGRISAPCPPIADELQRRKEFVDLGDRPAADQRQRAAETVADARQGLRQAARHHDLARRRRDVEQRAVDIEQNCQTIEIARV